jgi:hypothetical protein
MLRAGGGGQGLISSAFGDAPRQEDYAPFGLYCKTKSIIKERGRVSYYRVTAVV